jgi:hypothetical protein
MALNWVRTDDGQLVQMTDEQLKEYTDRKKAEYEQRTNPKEPEGLQDLRDRIEGIADSPFTEADMTRNRGAIAGSAQAAADESVSRISNSDFGGAAASFLSQRARGEQAVGTATGIADMELGVRTAEQAGAFQKADMLMDAERMAMDWKQSQIGLALEEMRIRQQSRQFSESMAFDMTRYTDSRKDAAAAAEAQKRNPFAPMPGTAPSASSDFGSSRSDAVASARNEANSRPRAPSGDGGSIDTSTWSGGPGAYNESFDNY